MQKDIFGFGQPQQEPSFKPLWLRVTRGVLWWIFLFFLGIFSFIFPPLGIPAAVLLYHNGKKIYALFPTLGVLALVFFQLFNQLLILLTR